MHVYAEKNVDFKDGASLLEFYAQANNRLLVYHTSRMRRLNFQSKNSLTMGVVFFTGRPHHNPHDRFVPMRNLLTSSDL